MQSLLVEAYALQLFPYVPLQEFDAELVQMLLELSPQSFASVPLQVLEVDPPMQELVAPCMQLLPSSDAAVEHVLDPPSEQLLVDTPKSASHVFALPTH